ncbi:hypothetical protein [Bradyrhizobium sp. Cp5.3]|uniref:hypothetical protein n=1 Tax=Bradyrhizobium sp. Cp5.3 TaxID=443598 RepID=UPI0003F7AB77|nr:hypothetical protein [Bradyrhizobium sp. Cp5.3]
MSTKFTKPVLAFSLLASLVAMTTAANAGATISDRRYWPNEVGPSSYQAADTRSSAHDAFAAFGPAASLASDVSGPRYVGGPKSSIAPTRGF